jgi:hypothetical protein
MLVESERMWQEVAMTKFKVNCFKLAWSLALASKQQQQKIFATTISSLTSWEVHF